jgi:AcrR family transcriptional regulator
VPSKSRVAKTQPYHHGDLRRALIETALQLVTEEQDWTFSLREVARRAGVSHRAPYNHFPEKLDLLAAVAAVGFERLRDGLLRAAASSDAVAAQLDAVCRAYMRLGLENPALYRLMFGPALSEAGSTDRPALARLAGAQARAVLEDVILRGGRSGAFAVSPDSLQDVALAALAAWSAVHGLTMMAIDKIPRADLAVDDMVDRMLGMVVAGLTRDCAEPPRRRRAARAKANRGAPSAVAADRAERRQKGTVA